MAICLNIDRYDVKNGNRSKGEDNFIDSLTQAGRMQCMRWLQAVDSKSARLKGEFFVNAGIAQLVEHDLAKVGVASSSLVSRSSYSLQIFAICKMRKRAFRPFFCI